MKGFNKRERRIISYAYHDAARICWERAWEENHDNFHRTGESMADHLRVLMELRGRMILNQGCNLPRTRKLKEIKPHAKRNK